MFHHKTMPITVAYGDGIGPEIMDAVLAILRDAKAPISIETIEVGSEAYRKGYNNGIPDPAWASIRNTKCILKGPITTPQGGGFSSLNVALRKNLGLYANVRPCRSYAPFVDTKYSNMNLVIIRENEEDLYTGIEYRETNNVYNSVKIISHTGCEKIVRFAFDYALKNHRKKVACMSKDNIMKFSDGILHKTFNEVGKYYKDIEQDHYIIDIGSARIATRPEIFDVIVTSNLYGDIISDIAAEVSGSVGLAGSANIGSHYAMFEAIHGSAPDIAGQNIANPSGLLNASIMMLGHLGLQEYADLIENAWLKTLEDGMHTIDIKNSQYTKKVLGTKEFAEAVIERFGQKPEQLLGEKKIAQHVHLPKLPPIEVGKSTKHLVGVDICIDKLTNDPKAIAEDLNQKLVGALKLQFIISKGLVVWPNVMIEIEKTDHWRLRFVSSNDSNNKAVDYQDVLALLSELSEHGYEVVKMQNLYFFDGQIGFALAKD